MVKKTAVAFLLLLYSGLGLSGTWAAERFKFGTPAKVTPNYVLPSIAAEEKALWAKQGLEVEWVALRGGGDLHRAVAAGALETGLSDTISVIQAATRGIPELIIADIQFKNDFGIWVKADGPIREAKDLAGVKLGIVRAGGLAHAYARLLNKALRLERPMKLVAGGGITEEIAALKAGKIDARSSSYTGMAALKFQGEVRQVIAVGDYLPREWTEFVLFSQKGAAEVRIEAVKRLVAGYFEALKFVMANRDWTVKKMISHSGFSRGAADDVFPLLKWGTVPTINRMGVENVRNLLAEYDLIPRDKAPELEALISERFIR